MTTSITPTDILILGGGIIGLSAAIAMRQRGYTVCLLDAQPPQPTTATPGARVYAINHASQQLLQSLDVWRHITDRSPYQHMHVWDSINQAHIDFDARLLGQPDLGSIIHETTLKTALLHECQQLGIYIHTSTRAEQISFTPDDVIIHSENDAWCAKFIIIADGAHSTIRASLNIPITTWSYHQHAIVATVQTEKPHQKTAYQCFHPDGPIAFLPLQNPHHCSIVWSTSMIEHAKTLMTHPIDAFNQCVTSQFQHKLGQVELMHDRHMFPLQMRHTTQYHGDRWILMGDAAHTIHPLAGLGLNVGLADLRVWLTLLDTPPHHYAHSRTLGAYQRQRKHAVWQTIILLEAIKSVFSISLTPMTTLRGLGLNVLNNLSFLKRLMIEHAEA